MAEQLEHPEGWSEYCQAAQELARLLRDDAERRSGEVARWPEFDAGMAKPLVIWGEIDRGWREVG